MEKRDIKAEIKLLAKLDDYLWENGGVTINPNIFEKLLSLRSSILQYFGLPEFHEYTNLLSFMKRPTSKKIETIEKQLHRYANEYLLSPVQSSKEFVITSVRNSARASDVLLELKLCTHEYNLFVYQKIIAKKKDTVANGLKAMRFVEDHHLLNDLGIVAYYDRKNEERKKAFLKLKAMNIPYWTAYLSYIRRQRTKMVSPNIDKNENAVEVPF